MKIYIKNRTTITLFLFLTLLAVFSGCAGIKKSPVLNSKEVLVTDQAVYQRPIWCATGDALVYIANWSDIFFYNLKTGQKEKIAQRVLLPIACTPDGESLIYLGSSGTGREDSFVEFGAFGLWTYEFSSREDKQLARVYIDEIVPFGKNILSPDGKMLLLGLQPKRKVEPSEGDLQIIWSGSKRTASSFVWLANSSGVVKSFWDEGIGRDLLEISTLVPDEKTFTIDPHSHEFLLWSVGGDGSIYMKVWDGQHTGAREILRCTLNLERQNASCESVLKRDRAIIDFDSSPDGEIIAFTEAGGRCVKALKHGEGRARCITPPAEHAVHNFSLSPDGQFVAYISDYKLYYRPFELASLWNDSFGEDHLNPDLASINNFKEKVKRDGDTLHLKTESGAYRSFSDTYTCEPTSWCTYEFIDYLDDPGFYSVSVSTYEAWSHIMISDRDGEKFYVYALPILSPDKGHLVVVSIDDTGWGANGVYIWRIEDKRLIPDFDYEPSSGDGSAIYFYFKQWKDNKTIELYKQFRPTNKLCPNADVAETNVSLRLEEDGWKFYENLSAEHVTCNAKAR